MAQSAYVEGEVIVTLKASATTPDQAARPLPGKRHRAAFSRHYAKLSASRRRATGLVRQEGKTTRQLIQELQADPEVETVEPNYLRSVQAQPNDSRFGEQWSLNNTGQKVNGSNGTSKADIRFLLAWAKARPATEESVVAVIDTGVDPLHADLRSRMWTNSAEIPNNGIDDDGNGYVDDWFGYDFAADTADPTDSGHHGTHVAGIIAAQGNNSEGIIGVHDGVRIMALKVSANGSTMSSAAVIEALEYALAMKQRGVPLVAINASYGGSGYSSAERAAIQAVGAAGIIVCAAAGNDKTNNNNLPFYPASYRLPNVIAVAATDHKDSLSSFSNYGSNSVDLAAPGSNILSTAPSEIQIRVNGVDYSSESFAFGGTTTGLTGMVYDCGIGAPGQFPAAVAGNIALIQRGELTFAEKVTNAQAAGAVAVIISNNVPAAKINGTLGEPSNWIPVRGITQEAGQTIRAQLPLNASLILSSGYQSLSGTSMAAPMVTAAVAFAAQNFPLENVTRRMQRILGSVDVKPSLQGKVITGGRLNLDRVVDFDQDGAADWMATELTLVNDINLKGGAVGLAYEEQFEVRLPTEDGYVFQLNGGTLPTGLSLSESGLLSGTPTAAGTSSFTVQVTSASGTLSGSKTFTLVVAAEAPQITVPPSPPAAFIGAPYAVQLEGTGGTAPYQWSLAEGELPEGLTLSENGFLSGYPVEEGLTTVTVKLVDANRLEAVATWQMDVAVPVIAIQSDSPLFYALRKKDYQQILTAEGGTAPYSWSVVEGALPAGLTLQSDGTLTGKPSVSGEFNFRILVRDANQVMTSKPFQLSVISNAVLPQVLPLDLIDTFVGESYIAQAQALHYPDKFRIIGLPKGLSYSSKTGLISGRAKQSGNFEIKISAVNAAGRSAEIKTNLTVRGLPAEWIGSFTGVISRDQEVNRKLGGRINLTTTSTGAYTMKVTTGAQTQSVKGYLKETLPQIHVMLNGYSLPIIIDTNNRGIHGAHGQAKIQGWCTSWFSKRRPALNYQGYYGASLTLANSGDIDRSELPQGAGYLSIRITKAGKVTYAGKTALGEKITASHGLGPQGEGGFYLSLSKHLGSLLGTLDFQQTSPSEGRATRIDGKFDWSKPANQTRLYPQGFEPLPLQLDGGYLAAKTSKVTVAGLPLPGYLYLALSGGGLTDSDNAWVSSFDFGNSSKLTLLAPENPEKLKLSINKARGLVTGSFVLPHPTPALKRSVSFQGMIIPQASGETKALGYFLLPQIPEVGQSISKAPQLSGEMRLFQIQND